MYLARQITETSTQSLDADEFLDVVRIPLTDAVQMVMENRIRDAKTQIALLKTAFLLQNEQNR